MDSVKTRLEKAEQIAGVKSRRALAEIVDIKYDTMNKWIDRDSIPKHGAIQIAAKIPISQTYLLTGEGDPEARTVTASASASGTSTMQADGTVMKAPVQFGSTIEAEILSVRPGAGRGDELEAVDLFDTGERILIDRSLLKTRPAGRLKALQVDGYSMVPMLFPDSWVVVDETKEFRGDGLYVINFDNTLMVKLLEANLSTGSLWVKSINPDYESWEIKPGDQRVFEIYGKVVRCII